MLPSLTERPAPEGLGRLAAQGLCPQGTAPLAVPLLGLDEVRVAEKEETRHVWRAGVNASGGSGQGKPCMWKAKS